MMKKKQRALIKLLISQRDLFKTSKALASDLSLSDRTVRTYLHHLKDILEQNGAALIAKQGYGYQLQVLDRSAFNVFLHSNDLQNNGREVADRKHYLLNLLLLEEQKIDLESLSEQIFISTSQLNKDILEIKHQLIPYELTIKKEKSNLYIDGTEQAKRHFIMNYFFNKDATANLQQFTYSTTLAEAISFDSLTIIILDECREAKLKLSDVMIQNIVLHLSLSIKRIQSDLSIQDLTNNLPIKSALEYQVAKKIMDRIESAIGFNFPAEEQVYLTLHLMAKSNLMQANLDSNLSRALDELFLQIYQETGKSFLEDEQLKNGLIQHLKPMIVRLKHHIKLKNPLLTEIKKNHLKQFKLTQYYCTQLPQLAPFEISEDESAYLTLHFLAAIEKQKKQTKTQVLIICATGIGSAQLLKNRVENEFGKRIHIVATKGYYELEHAFLDQVDLIISSIDLSFKVFKVPVLQVSVFLTDQDIFKIRQHLYCSSSTIQPFHHKKSTLEKNKIGQIIDELCQDYFYFSSQGSTKKAILEQLLHLLSVNEAPNYEEEMQKQMDNRMQLGEIFFSSTIVVPHPVMPVGNISKVGIALIPSGFFWNEQYPKVQFVFMISPSKYENPDLTLMTKAIVDLIDRPELQQQLLSCQTFSDFKPLFIQLMSKGA